MTRDSILTRSHISRMLADAKRGLVDDGCVPTRVFLRLADGEVQSVMLDMAETPEQRAHFLRLVGCRLQARGPALQEAVMVSEVWFVSPRHAPAAMKLAPSQHPAREEAIVIIGRSADNRRFTQVVQPFSRIEKNRPHWLPTPVAQYDEERSAQHGPVGILDCLFETIQAAA